jgi:multiple sugar transport system substrate-binding protein
MAGLLLPLLAAGCMSGTVIENEHEVARLGEEVRKKVVIWHTYSDEETNVFENEVIPRFESEYPDIQIESIRQTLNQEFLSALTARAAAGKTPDVIRMEYFWVPLFAQRNLLQPLDGMQDYPLITSKLRGPMLESNRYDEHVYGLPLNITTKAAIYNRALLAESGMAAPPASIGEAVALARSKGYVIGMSGIEFWNSFPYFAGLGGQLMDEGFTQTDGYLNSEASVAAVTSLLNLYREGILNPEMISKNADMWTDIYSSRKLLMIDEGPWYYSILMNTDEVDVDLLEATWPAPFPSDGGYGSIIGGESLVMTKGARHKPEAWTFMSWLTRKDVQLTLSKAGLIPVNMEAALAEELTDNPAKRYLEPYMAGMQQAFYRPAIPQWNEVEVIYNEAMENIFIRGQAVESALDEASAAIDELIGG